MDNLILLACMTETLMMQMSTDKADFFISEIRFQKSVKSVAIRLISD
jgi:hypothetical protein